MALYRVPVVEIHYVTCDYRVIADSARQAVERAEPGDAESQEWVEDYEVMGRFASGPPRKVRPGNRRR